MKMFLRIRTIPQRYWPHVAGGLFVLGCLVGWLVPFDNPFTGWEIVRNRGAVLRESGAHFQFINPLLACEIGSEQSFPELNPLKEKVRALITQKSQNGNLSQASVYIRTLGNSHWLEVNGNDTYAPASLLKVFVMMAYYKEADETDNPSLLAKQIRFEGNHPTENPGENIPHLVSGQWYGINDVIHQMIVYSDNDALITLIDNFDPQTLTYYQLIFSDLNIPSPVTQSESAFNFMTPDQYSIIFRVLFSSTYLSERYSEKALTILSKAHYKSGIVAGVSANVTVAHKFGLTTDSSSAQDPFHQLHDCGIVYYPEHPYLLCIMTKGKDFSALQYAIKDISATVYVWLDDYYKNNAGERDTRPY